MPSSNTLDTLRKLKYAAVKAGVPLQGLYFHLSLDTFIELEYQAKLESPFDGEVFIDDKTGRWVRFSGIPFHIVKDCPGDQIWLSPLQEEGRRFGEVNAFDMAKGDSWSSKHYAKGGTLGSGGSLVARLTKEMELAWNNMSGKDKVYQLEKLSSEDLDQSLSKAVEEERYEDAKLIYDILKERKYYE